MSDNEWISVEDRVPQNIDLVKIEVLVERGSIKIESGIKTVKLGRKLKTHYEWHEADWETVTHWRDPK